MKCFYDEVALNFADNVYCLEADGKALTTPKGKKICHKCKSLMDGILAEWQRWKRGDVVKVERMGLTCLLHGLLDGIQEDKFIAISQIQDILLTDLTLYRCSADEQQLRLAQDKAWSSMVQNFEESVGVLLEVRSGVMYESQDIKSVGLVYKWLEGLADDELLILSTAASRCGSLVLAFALLKGMSAKEIWEKCLVEERFAADFYGEDREELSRQKLLLQGINEVAVYRDLLRH